MGNKKIPDEVVTAMELAKAAGWTVSNRNKMIHIIAPDGVNISVSHNPNDESMKVFRSIARKYNLIGQGPARTREEAESLMKAAEAEGEAEAKRLNAQRKAYEAEQQRKAAQIRDARKKADAATRQGMNPPQETQMPKTTATSPTSPNSLFPPFDPALMGTKDNSKFLLADGTYYCIECLAEHKQATLKAPQGLAAHRSRWHQLYNESPTPTQETHRVSLPADVDTAMEMLRSAMAEALVGGADAQALADKENELAMLKDKLEAVTKQADADRKDFDKRFLEAQTSTDKRVADLLAESTKEANSKRDAEIDTLMKRFMGILLEIRQATESMSPIQAIAKIDTIVSGVLNK